MILHVPQHRSFIYVGVAVAAEMSAGIVSAYISCNGTGAFFTIYVIVRLYHIDHGKTTWNTGTVPRSIWNTGGTQGRFRVTFATWGEAHEEFTCVIHLCSKWNEEPSLRSTLSTIVECRNLRSKLLEFCLYMSLKSY